MATNTEGDASLFDTERGEWTLRDEDARQYVQSAVNATTSLVESTFGPNGMEKLVVTEDHQNRPETIRVDDAGRLLDAIERGDGFAHPIAALFVDGVDGMRSGLRDGTTASILLTGAFLNEGFALVERGIAPSNVIIGYAIARSRTGEILDDLARSVDTDDREILTNVAATTMTTALDPAVRQRLADHVAETIVRLADEHNNGWINTDDAKVLANPGVESAVYDGLILAQPDDADPNGREISGPIENPTVAIIDKEIDFEKTASILNGGDGVQLSSPQAVERYRSELEARIESTAKELVELGVDVLVCMEKLDDLIVKVFEQSGLAIVDKAKYPKEDVYRLARATNGAVVSTLRDLTDDKLGRADRITQQQVSDEIWTVFEGCPGPVYTIAVGSATTVEATRYEEAVADALETAAIAAMDGQVLPGAGAPAAAVAAAIREEATDVSGREQLAVDAFADALERIPVALARNAGHDPITALTALRTAHAAERRSVAGVDPKTGAPMDAWTAGVVEPRRVFSQAIETAAAVVEQLLTIDAVLYPNVELPGYTPRPERN